MCLIPAKTIFNFSMKLADNAHDCIQQMDFLMWQGGLFNVHLTPVVR
jgi:hypothetical protein